jgi:filamin
MTVQVGASSQGDASKVICSGDGLRVGTVGKDIRSFIDTRRAGPGELTAQCMGPRKTAYCELYDHADGTFTLNIRPQEPGKHALSIRYSGENVSSVKVY